MGADPVVRADEGAERGGRVAELEGHLHLLAHAEPEPAVFLRDGEAEKSELSHLGDDLRGHRVVAGYLIFQRHESLAHETPDGVDELIQRFPIDRHYPHSLDIPLPQPIMSPAGLPRQSPALVADTNAEAGTANP